MLQLGEVVDELIYLRASSREVKDLHIVHDITIHCYSGIVTSRRQLNETYDVSVLSATVSYKLWWMIFRVTGRFAIRVRICDRSTINIRSIVLSIETRL